ncbi:hypothetical protein [Phenylobacterium sp.]|uniref:hypothetical protein n=1 Tax=Phenylobacterium sp. TaxID=1871053 RepID=UPI002CA4C9E8|nr:hypothetical protein [Phenylobacterium sp.]HVI32633.1 hypothetical protein [Phenylobacterium sp.]
MSAVAFPDRPPIFIGVSDHRRLTAAAIHALIDAPRIAAALLEELERADIVPDDAVGADVARLGSWVEFIADQDEQPTTAQLVPQALSPQELPVLSTAGAALIGMRAGDTIRWPDRLGSQRVLSLLRVEPGALPAGCEPPPLPRGLRRLRHR